MLQSEILRLNLFFWSGIGCAAILYLYLTAARDANYSYAGALAILLALLIFAISGPFLRRISSR